MLGLFLFLGLFLYFAVSSSRRLGGFEEGESAADFSCKASLDVGLVIALIIMGATHIIAEVRQALSLK